MKKETIIAVILGIFLGLIVTVGILVFTQKKQTTKVIPVVQSSKITPIDVEDVEVVSQFELIEPENETIVNVNKIAIKGKSEPGSLLIVESPIDSRTLKTEKNEFEVNLNLALGENKILISYYPKNGNGEVKEKELLIYYLKEE